MEKMRFCFKIANCLVNLAPWAGLEPVRLAYLSFTQIRKLAPLFFCLAESLKKFVSLFFRQSS
jgi:hypothetical protein